MREIYSTGADWRETIPQQLAQKWNETCEQINGIKIQIPRNALQYGSNDQGHTLWVFSDASKMAIASCAYLQCAKSLEITQLISGKTRLTPKKIMQTIPRLELLGILIAIRLAKNIVSNLGEVIREVKIASDSEIALAWIPCTRKLPPFVSSQRDRIMRIKLHLENAGVKTLFYHVPTNYNPADAGTRGLTAETIQNHAWIRGPQWLKKDPTKWPLRVITEAFIEEENTMDEEYHAHPILPQIPISSEVQEFIDLSRFSKYSTALRTIAKVGKLLKKWTQKCSYYSENRFTVMSNFETANEITAKEIEKSEELLIALVHKYVSLEELQKRFHNMKIKRDENGIIRHESRIQNAILPYDTRSPIYIPTSSDLARLILSDIHKKNAHCGSDQTLALLRQRFWIPQPMKAIKKFVKKCSTCKRCHGLPYGAPEMPPLPKDRVLITKPFQKVGCDFLGPIDSNNNEKMYVCLYTCLTTRAVHLEVVENLTTGAFLNSFVRFTSRRGVPKLVRTDCGANFKLGQKIIETLFEKSESNEASVMTYSATEGITWIFNPPGAPWMGGVWERLVGSVKRCFMKAVGRRKVSFTELATVITRIEAILNTRPLTKIGSSEITEIPLRPVDFLQGNAKYTLPTAEARLCDPDYDPDLIQTAMQAHEAMQFSETTATKFWERWNVEYLTALRESQKRYLKQSRHTIAPPQVGEIVIIEQEMIPRGNWLYGKVTELIKSADGLIRSVKILMPNQKILQRPLNKIYPLEIREEVEENCEESFGNEAITDQIDRTPTPQNNNIEASTSEGRTLNKRRNTPRVSKDRAYEVIQNFERSLQCVTIFKTSKFTAITLLTIAMCLANGTTALPLNPINCNKGTKVRQYIRAAHV
ncbi:integrase core domain protein [Oesophagostomum dentatum]|uniref:Integrase core domain protein n=1 Tax=Oesophagostomum dentatum TaxID=61180 RepID=A0A0B1TU39_OESDE|nr:integrase core domain protein [Oesophagostomum dentatum]